MFMFFMTSNKLTGCNSFMLNHYHIFWHNESGSKWKKRRVYNAKIVQCKGSNNLHCNIQYMFSLFLPNTHLPTHPILIFVVSVVPFDNNPWTPWEKNTPTFTLLLHVSRHMLFIGATHLATREHPETITHLHSYYTSFTTTHTSLNLAILF